MLGTVFFHVLSDDDGASRIAVFRHAASVSTWVAVALTALTLALSGLMPARAREDAAGH